MSLFIFFFLGFFQNRPENLEKIVYFNARAELFQDILVDTAAAIDML